MFIPIYKQSSENIQNNSKGLILIFTEGTVIGPPNMLSLFNFKRYFPIGKCICKIQKWKNEGWDIAYLTSRKTILQVNEIRNLLEENKFPGRFLYYRGKKESYKDIAQNLLPIILIEDNCKSIGGKWQMTITYISQDIKDKIKSIVVKEFKGIDHLPESVNELLKYDSSK